ncbi:MAG: DUF6398 domain-containing protein [Verrucomicrobia bacterium]|nr:DUF6398 domain-containing protein [Verrucomicrobiota bacterium]
MIPFHSVLPEIAQREVRCIHIETAPGAPPAAGLPGGEYAFVEFYCEDLNCDCRRVFIQVIGRSRPDQVLASMNYGWEPESFYRERMHDPDAPGEIVRASLDPINSQSKHSEELLELFQQTVLDESYRLRLRRHYEQFREKLRHRQNPSAAKDSRAAGETRTASSDPESGDPRIPKAHRQRFGEVAALLQQFGEKHLDAELTGFVMELWKRICRRKAPDCLRGKPTVWAASVTHVIARMNFLFDRSQPVHLTLDTICDSFQTNKTTVGGKATQIERTLRLRQHCEPGLCRLDLLETFTNIRLSNGMVLSWKMAKQMGYVPADAKIEDLE